MSFSEFYNPYDTPVSVKAPKIKRVPIYVNGKAIGFIKGNTFYKTISGSRHIMRNPSAIFFDVSSLREAESLGATQVRIKDRETGIVYIAPISLIWAKPIYKNYVGEQVGLALNQFTVKSKPALGGNNE